MINDECKQAVIMREKTGIKIAYKRETAVRKMQKEQYSKQYISIQRRAYSGASLKSGE